MRPFTICSALAAALFCVRGADLALMHTQVPFDLFYPYDNAFISGLFSDSSNTTFMPDAAALYADFGFQHR